MKSNSVIGKSSLIRELYSGPESSAEEEEDREEDEEEDEGEEDEDESGMESDEDQMDEQAFVDFVHQKLDFLENGKHYAVFSAKHPCVHKDIIKPAYTSCVDAGLALFSLIWGT